MISGVCGGIIDMEMFGLNNFVGLLLVMNLFDVFFLFCDIVYVYKMFDGKVGDDLKVLFEGKGLKVLVYWENGWCDVINLCVLVKIFVDLKGLKICINNSLMNIVVFKVFGVNLILMLFVEVYIGLEICIIDV